MKFVVAYPTVVTVDGTQALCDVCDGTYYSLSQRNGFIWKDLIVLSYPYKLRACQFIFTGLVTLTV